MNKIFWGLLFLLIDLKINGFSLTPAFVGYILIYCGMKELDAPETFSKAKPWVIAGIIWTLLFWIPFDTGSLSILIGLVGTVIHLMVTWQLVQAVNELGADSESLRKVWTVMAVVEVLSVVLIWLPALSVIAVIVCFIAEIVYIVRFHQCKTALGQ